MKVAFLTQSYEGVVDLAPQPVAGRGGGGTTRRAQAGREQSA